MDMVDAVRFGVVTTARKWEGKGFVVVLKSLNP